MTQETYQHFRYEIALGAVIPMPRPKLEYFPMKQYSFQQFLHTICKTQLGSLGKKGDRWELGPDAPPEAALNSRPDITVLLDYSEKIGILIPSLNGQTFIKEDDIYTVYQLSPSYWERFDKFDE